MIILINCWGISVEYLKNNNIWGFGHRRIPTFVWICFQELHHIFTGNIQATPFSFCGLGSGIGITILKYKGASKHLWGTYIIFYFHFPDNF